MKMNSVVSLLSVIAALSLTGGLSGCNGPDSVTLESQFLNDSPVVSTREEPLMSLEVEREAGTHQFAVILAADPATQVESIQGLHVIDKDGSSKVYQPANLPQGVVLQKRSGRNVLTISSQDFNLETGGTLNLRYLYAAGAFSDSYRDFGITMSKNSDGRWQLFTLNADGTFTPFAKMKLLVNTRAFIGVVGIRKIVTE